MTEVFQFSRPLVLLGLLLVPLYAVARGRLFHLDAVPHAPLQYHAAARRWMGRLRLPLEVLLVATLVVALAGPHRTARLELMDDEGVDVVLVLDVSLSMLAEDFPPNRLDALRRIAGDFVRRSGGHRVGVLIFARDVYVQSPLTTDHPILLALLDGVTVHALDQGKSGGTAVGDALLVAADRLRKAKVEGRGQAVVLITDGESNLGADPVLAARYLRELEVRLYAIGVGGEKPTEVFFEGRRVGGETPYLAVLDDAQLRAVTAAADGRFYRAADVGALEDVFAELSRLESAPLELRTVELRENRAAYLALAALPLFAAVLTLGGLVARRPLR